MVITVASPNSVQEVLSSPRNHPQGFVYPFNWSMQSESQNNYHSCTYSCQWIRFVYSLFIPLMHNWCQIAHKRLIRDGNCTLFSFGSCRIQLSIPWSISLQWPVQTSQNDVGSRKIDAPWWDRQPTSIKDEAAVVGTWFWLWEWEEWLKDRIERSKVHWSQLTEREVRNWWRRIGKYLQSWSRISLGVSSLWHLVIAQRAEDWWIGVGEEVWGGGQAELVHVKVFYREPMWNEDELERGVEWWLKMKPTCVIYKLNGPLGTCNGGQSM